MVGTMFIRVFMITWNLQGAHAGYWHTPAPHTLPMSPERLLQPLGSSQAGWDKALGSSVGWPWSVWAHRAPTPPQKAAPIPLPCSPLNAVNNPDQPEDSQDEHNVQDLLAVVLHG